MADTEFDALHAKEAKCEKIPRERQALEDRYIFLSKKQPITIKEMKEKQRLLDRLEDLVFSQKECEDVLSKLATLSSEKYLQDLRREREAREATPAYQAMVKRIAKKEEERQAKKEAEQAAEEEKQKTPEYQAMLREREQEKREAKERAKRFILLQIEDVDTEIFSIKQAAKEDAVKYARRKDKEGFKEYMERAKKKVNDLREEKANYRKQLAALQ